MPMVAPASRRRSPRSLPSSRLRILPASPGRRLHVDAKSNFHPDFRTSWSSGS
jgi:hypothetical protein